MLPISERREIPGSQFSITTGFWVYNLNKFRYTNYFPYELEIFLDELLL